MRNDEKTKANGVFFVALPKKVKNGQNYYDLMKEKENEICRYVLK